MAMVLLAALQCAMIAAVAAAPVTFKVGLGGRQAAPEGVHLTGSFQGWDPAATAMDDADMDQIFEVTLELPEGRYEFKFINGNTFEQAEEVPESCSEVDSTHFNRYISVASDGAPEEVHVCFSACMPCGEIPTCKQFNCAAGFALKPAMLDYPGDSQASCCDQVPNDLKGVVVRSAGWSDGNRAEFWMNGDLLYATGTRGLTVVELLPKIQTVILNKTFDTYSDSSELESYLSSVAIGNLILMGAADEASTAFSSEAKNLVALCGGQLIQQIGYRSSYALIGQKADSPGQPFAEVLLPAGSGQAVAIARVEVPETFPELPFCETAVAEPPMLGTLAEDGNLQLDAATGGCRYRVRETSDATECLQGSWVVVTGSSNALLMWNTLLMMLAPSEAGDQRTGRFGGAHLLDAVIEDGVIIHYATVRSWLDTCEQSTAHGAVNETACRMTYAETLNNAPAHSTKRIRLTMFLSFYWARTGTALDLIETNQAWAAAKVNLLVQVVAWYIVCNRIKCDCCHRPNLVTLPEEEVVVLFQNEMAPVLERLGSFCAPTGRAAGHGCAVATNSFTMAGGTLGAMFSRFNALLTEALQTRKTPTLRYVDIYTLGASMPEETVQGHGTQILQLWTWQALLGGFCPSSIARPESQVQFDGPLCWKTSVTDLAECKTYSTYTGSSFWQCLNSQPCSLTVVSTQTLATTSTVTTTTMARFEPVDGGVGRACRGSSSSDNSAQYFDVVSVPTLDECKELCTMKQECVGVEYSGGRCELWTRPEGIEASIPLDGFTCLRLVRNLPSSTILSVTTTNTISPYFFPVDGGIDRACRGASSSDNLPSNYYVVGGIYELADCQEACLQAQLCVGIEFSAGRCEVWTRPNGIQASIALGGFTCMRYSMENDAAQKRRLFLAPREHSGYYA